MKGKYNWTVDLQFDWLGFDQANKSVVNPIKYIRAQIMTLESYLQVNCLNLGL